MSARTTREFSFERDFVASGGLLYAGKRYKDAEPFPWRTLKVSEGELYNLWSLGRVDALAAAPPVIAPAKPQHGRR